MTTLLIVLRVLHIFFACVAVGGLVFQRVALVPAAQELEETARRDLLASIRAAWSKWVMAAIGFLLLSGLINFVFTLRLFEAPYEEVPSIYHVLFGIKFLAALVVFFIVSILAGKREKTAKFRQQPKPWLNLCIVLVVVILFLSATLRSKHLRPPLEAKESPSATTSVEQPTRQYVAHQRG